MVSSNSCPHRGFDLLIANLHESLLVPRITSPPLSIPIWNRHDVNEVETTFEFAFSFLHDEVFVIFFVPKPKNVHHDVNAYAATYDFTLGKRLVGGECIAALFKDLTLHAR